MQDVKNLHEFIFGRTEERKPFLPATGDNDDWGQSLVGAVAAASKAAVTYNLDAFKAEILTQVSEGESATSLHKTGGFSVYRLAYANTRDALAFRLYCSVSPSFEGNVAVRFFDPKDYTLTLGLYVRQIASNRPQLTIIESENAPRLGLIERPHAPVGGDRG